MSFWMVPDSFSKGTPCFSATARYMAKMMMAGELMVMDVVTWSSGNAFEQRLHVRQAGHATPSTPTSPSDHGESES